MGAFEIASLAGLIRGHVSAGVAWDARHPVSKDVGRHPPGADGGDLFLGER